MEISDVFLSMWTIYDHPLDYPDSFIAREWVMNEFASYYPTKNIILAPDLESIQQQLKELGKTQMDRHPKDDKCIIEIWI
jgi:hypothetical protein